MVKFVSAALESQTTYRLLLVTYRRNPVGSGYVAYKKYYFIKFYELFTVLGRTLNFLSVPTTKAYM